MSEEIEIDGLDEVEVQNTAIVDLTFEDVNLMFLGIDASGSMNMYVDVMKEELSKFKKSIQKTTEAQKILVARANFSNDITIGGYKKIDSFDVNFQTHGCTAMYDTIVTGSEKLVEYMEFLRDQGMRVKAVFAIFSDGMDNASTNNVHEAKVKIEEMNSMEIVTAFICFGKEALRGAKELGFDPKNIIEFGRSESEIRKAFNTLSKSVISHSKSVGTSKNFFEM